MSITNTITKLHHLSKSAPRRQKEFSLGLLYTHNIMQQTHCAYSGREFTKDDPLSFERINNSRGYIEGNVIAVCTSLNSLRGSKTIDDLKEELSSAIKSLEKINSLAHYTPKVARTREEKIHEMASNPNGGVFDNVRGFVLSLSKSRLSIERANSEILRVEEKRLSLNDMNYLESHLQLQHKIINKSNAKIIMVEKSIDQIINKHFSGDKIKISNNPDEIKKLKKHISDLSDTIAGIKKFENLSRRQQLCAKFGIALDSSIKKLLKTWVVYNLS